MSDALADHAARTIAAGSQSFAAAARLFDPATRRSALMLYAWCRHCDDVVDDQTLGHRSASPRGVSNGEQRLAALRDATRRACAGEPSREPAFAALKEVVQAHRIAEALPQAHLDGFAMDVAGRRYDTLEDTLSYCYHVAGVVGVMMARIMGVEDEATLDRACDLGLAFQLTNIARDIVEDAEAGRCYLPARWLAEAGLSSATLTAPENREALAVVAARLIDTAEPYYASAGEGLTALPWRCAWAIATARGVYREIGLKVKARGAGAWDRRVSTGKGEKLRLLARGAQVAAASRGRRPLSRSQDLWTRPRLDAGDSSPARRACPAGDA